MKACCYQLLPRPAPGDTITLPMHVFRALDDNSRVAGAERSLLLVLSDPAAAAWFTASRPAVDAPAPIPGVCGRCGENGPTVTSSHIISERFADFDSWPFGSRRLCVPCAWAYSHHLPTQPPMLITTTTTTEYVDAAELGAVLSAGPLQTTEAAMMPGQNRRFRHVLPNMRWGHLSTDRLTIAWDAAAAQRLSDQVWLRATVGASWAQLTAPVPAASLVTAQPPEVWARVLAAWESLQQWRAIPALWLATKALSNRR